ncbi:LysR family substrate-binding domain-containing protein [Microbacterium sp. NPDC076911]|uniref:LysR family substrate-binding domain-containing protein n=1 Tax=Microbacterium sp. NPDC076911 TaxID=3154958 RepID=UPI00341E8EB8
MVKGGGSRGRPRKSGRDTALRRTGKSAPKSASARTAHTAKGKKSSVEATPEVEMPPRFTLGVIPGATPGKWIDAWNARMPRTSLDLVQLSAAEQHHALMRGEVDAAIVRLPINKDGLHVIELYSEEPVVVASIDSHLTAAETLMLADLTDEVVIVAEDDVLNLAVPGAVSPSFTAPADAEEAIKIVAAGVGIIIVPMSIARAHRRKDTAYRVLSDGPVSPVGIAWIADSTNPAIDVFIGIVRGRTAHSSRS